MEGDVGRLKKIRRALTKRAPATNSISSGFITRFLTLCRSNFWTESFPVFGSCWRPLGCRARTRVAQSYFAVGAEATQENPKSLADTPLDQCTPTELSAQMLVYRYNRLAESRLQRDVCVMSWA